MFIFGTNADCDCLEERSDGGLHSGETIQYGYIRRKRQLTRSWLSMRRLLRYIILRRSRDYRPRQLMLPSLISNASQTDYDEGS